MLWPRSRRSRRRLPASPPRISSKENRHAGKQGERSFTAAFHDRPINEAAHKMDSSLEMCGARKIKLEGGDKSEVR